MINVEIVEKCYEKYIKKYDCDNEKILMEIQHMYKTSQNAKWLAESLELSKEDIKLAQVIGLLHNIGKLEQIKQFETLMDKNSMNHAEYAVKVLFKDNFIRSFIEENKYDEIIKLAIQNHNKPKIENINNDKELIQCKIIRDADKLNIFNMILNNDLKITYPIESYTKEKISDKVKKEFIKEKIVTYKNINSCADLLAMQIALVFDINYLYSLKKINDENYLERIIEKFDAKDENTIKDLNELKEIAGKYIQEKIKEGKICLKNY